MASLPLVRRHQDTVSAAAAAAASAPDEKPAEITKRGIVEALISVRGAAASSASASASAPASTTAVSRMRNFLAALTLASLGSTILSTTFNLFNVETFLTAYELPLSSYAFGTFIYTIIDVINDIGGAYFVDAYAMRSSRGAIGKSGCLLALCFLAPFFRGGRRIRESPFLATSHFIISVSSYDTLFTFLSMLIGSYFTDNAHTLSESTRINFTASGKIVNLIGSFVVGRVGLELFDTDDMTRFRVHVLMLSGVACALFVLAQRLMYRSTDKYHDKEKGGGRSTVRAMNVRRHIAELCRSENFLSFIGMEALLEAEVTFSESFGKVFFDRLLVDLSEETADNILATISPASQVLSIMLFMPIRRIGYRQIYVYLFQGKIVVSAIVLLAFSSSSTAVLTMFLVINQIATAAVQTSCFYLCMADLTMFLKYKQAKQGHMDDSFAGLIFGINAVFCKPVIALIPIVAAWSLARVGFSTGTHTRFFKIYKDTPDEVEVRQVLFHLLVIPPLVLSSMQLLIWRYYSLASARAEEVRLELKRLRASEDDQRRLGNGGAVSP